MIVRVVQPPYGKEWIYNGYAQKRVYVGELTELPDELDKWDDDGKHIGRKPLKVPKWAEFVRDSDPKPLVMRSGRAPEDEKPAKETLAATIKRVPGRSRGTRGGLVNKRVSDTSVGE